MKRVRYSVAMSLDGFIAGPSGEFDWIPMDPAFDFGVFMNRFDTVLLGRVSYEATLAVEESTGGGMMADKSVHVFSTTLRPEDHPDVIISPDPVAVVSELKQGDGKEIWLFGGGVLFRSLLQAGLVDTVEVAIIPTLLGQGLPMLPTLNRSNRLRLDHSQVYSATGMVLMEYSVVEADG